MSSHAYSSSWLLHARENKENSQQDETRLLMKGLCKAPSPVGCDGANALLGGGAGDEPTGDDRGPFPQLLGDGQGGHQRLQGSRGLQPLLRLRHLQPQPQRPRLAAA